MIADLLKSIISYDDKGSMIISTNEAAKLNLASAIHQVEIIEGSNKCDKRTLLEKARECPSVDVAIEKLRSERKIGYLHLDWNKLISFSTDVYKNIMGNFIILRSEDNLYLGEVIYLALSELFEKIPENMKIFHYDIDIQSHIEYVGEEGNKFSDMVVFIDKISINKRED